jgi:hypothetical protein
MSYLVRKLFPGVRLGAQEDVHLLGQPARLGVTRVSARLDGAAGVNGPLAAGSAIRRAAGMGGSVVRSERRSDVSVSGRSFQASAAHPETRGSFRTRGPIRW